MKSVFGPVRRRTATTRKPWRRCPGFRRGVVPECGKKAERKYGKKIGNYPGGFHFAQLQGVALDFVVAVDECEGESRVLPVPSCWAGSVCEH